MMERPTQRLDESTIERARWVRSLVDLVRGRVKLSRAGRGWKGCCPFHDEKTPSFTVDDTKGFYHCFGCGAHGSAIDWVMETGGCGFREAVAQLLGDDLPSSRAAVPAAARRSGGKAMTETSLVNSRTAGEWIYRTSGPARESLVERYLASRGLDPATMLASGVPAIEGLRYHPRCPLGLWKVWEDPREVAHGPAMVAPIRHPGVGFAPVGVHVTYLASDGNGKARFARRGDGSERPTRKMFGQLAGGAVCFGPSGNWTEEGASEFRGTPLIVGEGIETTWAFVQSFGRPCRAVAALSLQNLQGGIARNRDGSWPMWDVAPDFDQAPFLLPQAGEVVLLVDADMNPLKRQKLQRAKGQRWAEGDITGIERAEICARVAARQWHRAGAQSVTIARPPLGMDFNDAVRAA